MAIENEIKLILSLILAGDFDKASALLGNIVAQTKQIETAAQQAGQAEDTAAKAKIANLERVEASLKAVREAQKLVAETSDPEDELASLDLLVEAQKELEDALKEQAKLEEDLGEVQRDNDKKEEEGNKKQLSDKEKKLEAIRKEIATLVKLQEQQRKLSERVDPNNPQEQGKLREELLKLDAQIAGTKKRISDLRGEISEVGESTDDSKKSVNGFVEGLRGVNDQIAETADVAPEGTKAITGLVDSLAGIAENVGLGGLGLASLLGLLGGLAGAAIEAAKSTQELAKEQLAIQKSTGASASFVAALTSIIKQYGGETANVTEALLQVGGPLSEALSNGAGSAAKNFEVLGIEIRNAQGQAKSLEEIFREIDRVAAKGALTTEQRVAIARLLGEEALKQFADKLGTIEKIEEQLKSTGAVLSEEFAEKADKFTKSSQLIQDQIQGISFALTGDLLDAFNIVNRAIVETLAGIKPDDLEGVKALIGDLARAFLALGETGAKGLGILIDLSGDLATGINALLNPIDTLNALINNLPVGINNAAQASKKLIENFNASALAIDDLNKKIAGFNLTQSLAFAQLENDSAAALEGIEKRLRLRVINEEQAAQERLEIERKLLREKDNLANQERTSLIKFVEEQRAIREGALKKEENEGKDIIATRIQRQKEFTEFSAQNSARITELSKQVQDTEKELNDRIGEGQKRLLRDKLKAQQDELTSLQTTLDFRFRLFKQAQDDELTIKKNVAGASEDLAKFERALALDQVVLESEVGKELFALRQVLISNKIKLGQTFRASNSAENKAEVEEEKAKVADITKAKTEAIAKANATEASAIAEQRALLQSKERTAQEVETQITKINIVAQQDRLNAAIDALARFKEKKIQDSNQQKELEKSISDESIKLNDLKTKQTIDNINKEISVIKTTIEITDNINLKALQKIDLEQKVLELLKAQGATKEQLLLQEKKINDAINDAIKLRQEQDAKDKKALEDKLAGLKAVKAGEEAINDRIEKAAGTTEGFIERNKELGNIITQIAKKFEFAFDPKNFDETNIDVGKKKLAEFQQLLADTQQDLLTGSGALNSLLLFQQELATQAIDDLTNKLSEASSRLAAENARKAAEAQAQIQREFNESATEELKDSLAEQSQTQREHAKEIKDLKQEIVDNNNKLNKDIETSEGETAARIEEIFRQARERDAKEREKEAESIKTQRIKLAQELEEIENQSRRNKAQSEIDEIKAKGDIAAQVDAAQASVASAKTAEERQRALAALLEVTKKLEEFNKKKAVKDEAEKTRNEKIKKAEEDLVKEKEAAKTDEELKAAEERFNIKRKAAEDEYDDALKAQNAILDLLKQGRTKEAEEIRKKAEELSAINAKTEADRLKAVEENLARQKELRAKAEAEKKAELEKQAEEEKKRGDEEIQRLKDQAKKREEEIKAQIEKENKLFNKATKEREEKTAAAIAALSKDLGLASEQLADYVTNLAKSLGVAADKIKPIADAIASIKNNTASGSSSSPGSSPSSSSSSPSTSNNSGQSSSGGSVFGGQGGFGFNKTASSDSTGASSSQPSAAPSPSTPSPSPNPTAQSNVNQNRQSSAGIQNQPDKQPAPNNINIPGQIKTADEYSKIVFAIFEQFDKAFGKQLENGQIVFGNNKNQNYQNLANNLANANYNYAQTAGLTKEEIKTIAPSMPYLLGPRKRDKNRKAFTDAVNTTIKYVEANRKQTGNIKEGTDTSGGGITPPPTPKGNTKGNLGDDPTGTKNPSSITPPPTPPKDTRFDPKRENPGEGFNEFTDKIEDPDSGIPKAPGSTASPTSPSSPSAPTAPQINSNPTIAPTIAPKFEIKIVSGASEQDINKTLTNLTNALQSKANQAGQNFIREIMTLIDERLSRIQ